jgi:hypothetical protein
MATESLFKLRQERDSLIKELEHYEACFLEDCAKGNCHAFKNLYYGPAWDETLNAEFDCWTSETHSRFYAVCMTIKEAEARLYDQAMKGAA